MTKAAFAFQGALGAFSHQAAIAFAQQLACEPEMTPCQTFGEVFEAVAVDGTTYGVIPLENSSIGSIVANYDLLWGADAFIIAEYILPVHHHLIGLPGAKLEDVRTVLSHPAALDQCRRFFKKHPQAVARVHWDTSGAVAEVKQAGQNATAAIAGELAAQEYGMRILQRNIEDFNKNATRFGLIRGAAASSSGQGEWPGNYKLSLAVELNHKVGSLAILLNALAEAGANLTKIESRPIGESPWHYRFFLDAEVPSVEAEQKLSSVVTRLGEHHKILGRYRAESAR